MMWRNRSARRESGCRTGVDGFIGDPRAACGPMVELTIWAGRSYGIGRPVGDVFDWRRRILSDGER